LKKVMDFAAQYQIKSGFHGPTDISPVGFAAQLHVGLAIHNYGIQEYMQHSDKTNEVFEQSMTFTDGYLHPGRQAGHRRRIQRGSRSRLPVPAGLPALQPPRRRHRP
jgi:mannonate dehydratase